MGEVYVWSEMDAGNWRAHRWKGKFDIETGWAQQVLERWGVKPRHWNEMKIHEDTCKKMLRDAGGIVGTRKWMPEGSGWNLDIETRCMQEGVERNGGTCRYWSQVTAENWWERGRWERGKLDIETRMNARSCWDGKRKSGSWTQMTVHARSCGETRGSWGIETAWMREAVERHRWGDFRRLRWNQI